VNLPLAVLPYAPPPHTDELLSSWIERLGHFYGIGYLGARVILEPSRAANKRGVNEDLDSSESIRNAAILWSGFAERLMPPVVPMDDTVLEASARLAYCAECWNEDVERGQSPYIRRKWINWLCVACSEDMGPNSTDGHLYGKATPIGRKRRMYHTSLHCSRLHSVSKAIRSRYRIAHGQA
jgi:hypothetical protein